MKNKYKIIIPVIVVILLISILFYLNYRKNTDTAKVQTTKDIDDYIDTDDGDEDIDWTKYEEYNITTNDSTKITNAGIYLLSGTIAETITINTPNENVKLILNNATINPTSGAGIIVEEADNVVIYLRDGTTNVIEDTSTYSYDNTDIDGAIYAKDDLIFDGTGTLNITSNYKDAIVSKDDLKIINGEINITSNDDGIRGKDSVYIINGGFNITARGDGIKSTNDTEADNGYVLIENGKFNIESGLDGIQAETKLVINNGEFNIKTGGGSSNSSTSDNWGRKTITKNASIESAKGLKAVSNIVIKDGIFTFDTADDAIHSNDYVGIANGNIDILSGDDGIHADTKLIIDGGSIDITKSYEGIESSAITINNGEINVIASDDGINIAGGNDGSAMNRPGENTYNNSNNKLIINNGKIKIDAKGDGIDVNGSAYIYDGEIYIEGPIDSGNGIIDYDKEFVVDGGTLIGSGSSGMLQSITSNKQYNVVVTFNNTYKDNSIVQITNSNNEEIITYTPSKSFSAIIVSSPLFKGNENYTINVNNEVYDTFKTTSLSNEVGNNFGNGIMPGGKGEKTRR